MKIYTKTGDSGTTSLIGGERVPKFDERVEAYGAVDELTAFAALLGDMLRDREELAEYVSDIERITSQLMTVASLLAVGRGGEDKIASLKPESVEFLEKRIDAMQAAVVPITKFTVPGGCREVSVCHVCRTVCRRAERAALRANEHYGVDRSALVWLNRLSDWFYLLGRVLTEHFEVEEVLWRP